MKTVEYFVSDDGKYGNTDKSKVMEYDKKTLETNQKNKVAQAEYDRLTGEINKLDDLIKNTLNKKYELIKKRSEIKFTKKDDKFVTDLQSIIDSFPSFEDMWENW